MFVVAFCTMSRVGEMSRIGVEDILDKSEAIRPRPKTEGAIGKAIIKCVSGSGNLVPMEIMKKRYREAVDNGRKVVFTRDEG